MPKEVRVEAARAVPPQVVEALSKSNELATSYEREAKSARLIGDSRASDDLLRRALEVRSRAASLAEPLIEGEDAPCKAPQLDFRRSLGRLHLSCGIVAIRLGDWSTAREHGLRALQFDKRLKKRVLSLLVTADVAELKE
jgi:hypothetical protein